MSTSEERAHGVTPSLREDYEARTAARQAAFLLPHLHANMKLLDVGCGPGSISVGLAGVVAPGQVIGIDHDTPHVEAARTLAARQGVTNVAFQVGDALSLPFADETFSAAFENNVFTHLSRDAVGAAREVYRVLEPGGLFAARDVDTSAVIWGHRTQAIERLNHLFTAWVESKGSDLTLGHRLPEILRRAGFVATIKSVSADTKGTPEEVQSHARITLALLDGPFGRDVLARGWADQGVLAALKTGVQEWSCHPDAFFANVHVEVIGFKPAMGAARDEPE